MEYLSLLKQYAAQAEEQIIDFRRTIHSYPELATEEWKTAELVAARLRELGFETQEKIGKTGVVGILRGTGGTKTVGLRADMDALPIKEETGLPFQSKQDNIMHACGHDAHTAMLLGAAEILANLREYIPGSVKLIFQPSEESPLGGAKDMIAEGVLKNPDVNMLFGLHVDPHLPAGTVGYRKGAFFACGSRFEIEISGQGGHAALPHQAVNPIVIAAEIILALQGIAAAKIDPVEPFVLTVGTITAGTQSNVIAEKAVLGGTLRCFKTEIAEQAGELIEQTVKSIASLHGAQYQFSFSRGLVPLINDDTAVDILTSAAREIAGKQSVVPVPQVLLGEDFSLYCQQVPAAFFALGTGFAGQKNYQLHHSKFNLNESALVVGAAVLANAALASLRE
ncbi:MAG: amidohydrolase [Sporomusa sp.]|jgi:amidohydrolase|nr:amidohydrolase [Sporomusa sp.]